MTIKIANPLTPTVEAPAPLANMGQPVPRYDARDKVMGQAKYGSDFGVARPAFAYLVTSAISLGTIKSFDLESARKVPGVLDILTHENMAGQVKKTAFFASGGYMGSSIRPLESADILHDGQIIAVVLAESFENAREAAYRIKVDCETRTPASTFDSDGVKTWSAKAALPMTHEDPGVGDAEKALGSAEVVVEARYSTPTQHHNPMELFTTTCSWEGDQLTIIEPTQNVYGLKNGLAEQIGIEPDNIRVISPFIGGAFGSRGSLTQRSALIALAARKLGRPVKLVATRDQGFTIATYRAETRHHVKLGASKDGKLTALSHEGWEITSRPDSYKVGGTEATARMYACPNISTKVNIVYADRNTPGFMRSPPEVPYMFALESAMDELAEKLGMDPVELRRINDTAHEPIKGLPYSSRSLMTCFDQAATAFGWSKRDPKPGSMRDGDWLIGWGCATTTYPTQMAPATARIRLNGNGAVQVETAGHEIGNGAYTVIAQTAAEKLGVSVEHVTVKLGDSSLPPAPVAGGSISTASVCSAVAQACEQLLRRLGNARGDAATDITGALSKMSGGSIEEYAEWVPDGSGKDAIKSLYKGQSKIVGGAKLKNRMQHAFGAEFVELRIHVRTKEIRVPRVVGAFAAGHIVNPRTARSQLMGALIWGVSSALHESTEIDARTGRYINDNLADYLIPVNADINQIDVIFVPETDAYVNELGIKGLGELGNVGTNAAVANAVYHATGKRCRDLPIRIDHLIG